jgi:hypothetical protein
MQSSAGAHSLQIVFQLFDARGYAAAVGFEFCFAGAARADSAAETRQRMTLAGKTREPVFQLREFDLQTPFGRACAMGEYVENQLGAVDDLDLNGGLEVPLLRRRELVIDNQDVGLMSSRQFLQLLDLAISKQRSGVEDGSNLEHLGHYRGAGAGGQFGKLAKRFGGSSRRRPSAAFETCEDGFLRVLFQ